MSRPVLRPLVALLCSVLGTHVALADRVLFESYVGNRPAEAGRIAPLIRSVFERHSVTTDPLVLAMYFREHAFRPGLVSPKLADMLKRVERRAEDDFWEERYAKVIEDLHSQIVWMRQNPQVFAREPKHRETALRILVFYALACNAQSRVLADNKEESEKFARLRDDTMAEVIRSYPAKLLTAKTFGEDGERLFLQMRDKLNQAGRGRISVTVSDQDAVIYINEVVQGTSKVDAGDFVPGIYRVLIVRPTGEGRQYEVEVTASQTARLAVDWDVDSILVLDGWAGFRYPSEKEHSLEATLVHMLAQKHTNADVAITITVVPTHGHLSVAGTSYETRTGRLLHTGSVELIGSPANDTQLNRLAECVISGDCAEGVVPVSHPEYTPPPVEIPVIAPVASVMTKPADPVPPVDREDSPRGGRTTGLPTWLPASVMGLGALTIAGGAVEYVRRPFDQHRPPSDGTDGKNPLVGVMVSGSVVLGGGVYLWSRESLSARPLTAGTLGAGTASIAAGVQLYLVSQEPAPNLPIYIRRTAPMGVAIGAAGLAMTGTGLWLLHRERTPPTSPDSATRHSSAPKPSWMPFAVASASQVLLGCTGSL